jgi:MraZ protein
VGKCGTLWEKVGDEVKLFAFKGTYNYSIDQKGRLSIPVKFRDKTEAPASEHYVVARGFEGCLYLYPREAWAVIEEKLSALKTLSDPRARYFVRTLLSNAADTKIDKLGRIMIPQNLLDLAGIKKDIVVRGVLDKIEIWDPEVLRKYEESQSDSYEDVAGQLLI